MYAIVLVNLYFKMQAGQNILSNLLFYVTIFDTLRLELKDLTFLFMHFNKFQAASNQVEQIYVLDESTSNLDKETEKLIVNLIQKYLKNKTLVIVTHRDEIKRICQKHYVFEENKIRQECFDVNV